MSYFDLFSVETLEINKEARVGGEEFLHMIHYYYLHVRYDKKHALSTSSSNSCAHRIMMFLD